jgi:lysophospholipase L1-like esterase
VAGSVQAGQDRLSGGAKWAILAGATLALVALVSIGAEIAVRVRQAASYGTAATIDKSYVVDERIGLRVPIANLRSGNVVTNGLGFRGPEIVVPKPAGTVRVAFLGASTTWCAEVSGNDATWPHVATEELRRAFPRARIDYVNGGVPGYVVESSLRNLVHRVAPLQPDVVIIYHATNDMSAEVRELAAAKGLLREARVEPPSWLADHSLLWNLAEKNYRIWIAQRKAEANVGRLEVDAPMLGERFRRNLTGLVRAAQQRASVVAIATFSSQLRVGQDPEQQIRASASALYYMPFMTTAGLLAGYGRYNQIIREVAAETGAVLVEGENEIPGDPLHFADTVHFTDAGARAMAGRVARALAQRTPVQALFGQ